MTLPLIVIVYGGRDYADHRALHAHLDRIHAERGISMVRHGCAKGADRMAEEWAVKNGIRRDRYAAYWGDYGPAAGPMRNQQMVAALPCADIAIQCPGGRGTADMRRRLDKAGITVFEVMP